MDQGTRNKLQRATQQVRRILEEEFAEQLEGAFDVLPDGKILPEPGQHLDARQRLTRQKLVAAIDHIKAGGKTPQEAVDEYTSEAAFTFLNRFVALRMLEARGLLQECVSKGDASSGFKEFCGLAPGLSSLDDGGYRLYLECLFDELTVEVKVLFDRRDSASLLWPGRGALTELLDVVGQADLVGVWSEDETIGWVYQYFNSGEERKRMREESQAPRNSRELAVRNQFFTPRYVVQFLTDNTLGRIWYEMRKGQTRLVGGCQYLVRRPSEVFLEEGQDPPPGKDNANSDAEQDLSQEDLLKKTVYNPHRAKKDPRDLKILDPACGSGHFLLYAFDLLISIYEEAWHDEASPESEVTGKRLQDDYTDLEQLHAALPGLVLAHNLHGIDIDPRAAQIAALALWMRGQRAFNEFGIKREQRPAIARSNIVCAEPMPGEAAFLDEFIAEHLSGDAEGQFLASLVRKVFDAMKLAGEAGSLLKIEEDIAEEVAKAKKQWLERPDYKQSTLFDAGPKTVQRELELPHGITDESFWEEAEQRIYDALRSYAETASLKRGYQRLLFAKDAARGFAMIDGARQRYSVVLMNPPFGDRTSLAKQYCDTQYKSSKGDLFSIFIERGLSLLQTGGMLGAITSRTGFFLSTFKKWREEITLKLGFPTAFADLGYGVLDSAMVETAAYCLAKEGRPSNSTFFKLQSVTNKDQCLVDAIESFRNGHACDRLRLISPTSFKRIKGSPFVYWVSSSILNKFTELPSFETSERFLCLGDHPSDDFRWLRLSWEVPSSTSLNWMPYLKGNNNLPFFDDVQLAVDWDARRQTYRGFLGRPGRSSFRPSNVQHFGKVGLTFPNRPHRRGHFAHVYKGCAFSNTGPFILVSEEEHWALSALLNSDAYISLLHLLMPRGTGGPGQTLKYEVGYLGTVPIPKLLPQVRESLAVSAIEAFKLRRDYESTDETCRFHLVPGALRHKSQDVESSLEMWMKESIEMASSLSTLYASINEQAFLAYGLSNSERFELSQTIAGCDTRTHNGCVQPVGQDEKAKWCFGESVAIVSYCIGFAFGRWGIAWHQSLSVLPGLNEHFRDLPHRQPAETCQPRESLTAIGRDILVDDPGHVHDLLSAVEQGIETLWGNKQQADALAGFLGSASLRLWMQKTFFSEHKKRYSKSRRSAPIYWQLATPTASYSVWLYFHRLTKDTFFRVLNEVLKPKLNHERQTLGRVQKEGGAEPTQSQRKESENQEKLVAELTAMVEEVERIAPMWNPDLNDGVIINFAPLWRLVPQNNAWQKDCKSCWDKLVEGDYDWAHLAMHLWPERVVPKCVTDASLAIAHGLEEVFWQQDDRDRFQPKEEPQSGWEPLVTELINKRTSPAVKAALQSLLDAPAPAGNTRSRRRRATT